MKILWCGRNYLIQAGFPGHKEVKWFESVSFDYSGQEESDWHNVYYIGPFCISIQYVGDF